MAKIAVALERALDQRKRDGSAGSATAHVLAAGDGWRVADVICTSGPDDRPFEEQHARVSVAVVAAGTFQYRSTARAELLTPGALMLGNPGQSYVCAHEHGSGDRCIAFQFAPELFERLFGARPRFRTSRLPPLRASAPTIARACAALAGAGSASWEELSLELAGRALQLTNGLELPAATPAAIARVTGAVRSLEENTELSLQELAGEARLSVYHFLRTFTQVTGVTPHQFALRARLRDAALRLAVDDTRVIDVALDSGFGDVSHFNRTFKAEFGVAPRAYRAGFGRRVLG
ncbi:MAG TPA: AraC family transcriptional regulator [Thermoanaerobaculia bacterium]